VGYVNIHYCYYDMSQANLKDDTLGIYLCVLARNESA
jgi:hypothetical protein